MQNTGERQVSPTLNGIKPDHLQRYLWAVQQLGPPEGYVEQLPLIADIACGCGYGSYLLADVGRVIGVDISQDAIAFANKNYRRTELNPVFVCGDALTLCITSPVEAIVSFETIEHVSEYNAIVMMGMFESITDRVFLSVPNEDVLQFSAEKFPFHHRHYSPDQLESLLSSCGWSVAQWWTQYDKHHGAVSEGSDGRTLIVEAVKE